LRMSSDNNNTEYAIKISDLSKTYQIFNKPSDRLKQMVASFVSRLFGLLQSNFYREFKALDNISFELRKGETLGVVGKNGAGKSTLLQLVTGTLSPTSGSVEVNGRIAALLELGSGFNPEFTGRQNVYLNASILGLSSEQIDERYDQICEFADIGKFIDQPVKTYSSGMTLRLAFSVIAHVDADVLIIDEALAVGDAYFSQKCMRFLREFMKTGSVLFVSHDAGAVANLCDMAIYLEHGKLKMLDTPKRVTEKYLQDLYDLSESKVADAEIVKKKSISKDKPNIVQDVRLQTINNSNLANKIEIFHFEQEASSFGIRGATITDTCILNEDGERLLWVLGGSNLVLKITAQTHQELESPIIGFQLKDKLGQILFADNTFLTYQDKPLNVPSNSELCAFFHFYLPVMPEGEYSISPALATGTQHNHIQHHWVHDGLILNVRSSSVPMGLVGLQFSKIEMTVQETD